MRIFGSLMLGVASLAGSTAWADPTATCPPNDALALPAVYAAWPERIELSAARGPSDLVKSEIPIGQAANVSLLPMSEAAFPAAPGKDAEPNSLGGLVGFEVDGPGIYEVAVSGHVWIDVFQDGRRVRSLTHRHPSCTTIGKSIEYQLQPGRYVLGLSGATQAATVMIVRYP